MSEQEKTVKKTFDRTKKVPAGGRGQVQADEDQGPGMPGPDPAERE